MLTMNQMGYTFARTFGWTMALTIALGLCMELAHAAPYQSSAELIVNWRGSAAGWNTYPGGNRYLNDCTIVVDPYNNSLPQEQWNEHPGTVTATCVDDYTESDLLVGDQIYAAGFDEPDFGDWSMTVQIIPIIGNPYTVRTTNCRFISDTGISPISLDLNCPM